MSEETSIPGTHGPENRSQPHAKRLRPRHLLATLALAAIAWNYWLPTAEDYFNQTVKPECPPNCDFFAYHLAGEMLQEGKNPYYFEDSQTETRIRSEFIYPPAFLPLYRWLASRSYDTARLLWLELCGIAYGVGFLSLLWVEPGERRANFALWAAFLTLTSHPLLIHLRQGQSDLIVTGLVLLSFALHSKGHRHVSAFLLALGFLFKVSPVILLAYFVVFHRDGRYLVTFLVTTLALGGLSLALLPADLYRDYVLDVLPFLATGTTYWHNQSIIRLFAYDPNMARGVTGAGLLGVTWLAWRLGRARREVPTDGAPQALEAQSDCATFFFVNILVTLLFSAYAWPSAYVLTLLPGARVLATLPRGEHPMWHKVLSAVGVLLLNAKVYGWTALDSLNLLGNVLLTCALTTALLVAPQPSPHTPRQ